MSAGDDDVIGLAMDATDCMELIDKLDFIRSHVDEISKLICSIQDMTSELWLSLSNPYESDALVAPMSKKVRAYHNMMSGLGIMASMARDVSDNTRTLMEEVDR